MSYYVSNRRQRLRGICHSLMWCLVCVARAVVVRQEFFTSNASFLPYSSVKGEFVEKKGRTALKVEWLDEPTKRATHFMNYNFTFDSLSYQAMRFSVWWILENVSRAAESYNGAKLMYPHKMDGTQEYTQQSGTRYGTIPDWALTSFDIICSKECKVENGQLIMGLQGSTGTVYFSNLTIELLDLPKPSWTIPEGFKCEYTNRVTSRSRGRGGMSPVSYRSGDFVDFKQWNGNFLRWQINGGIDDAGKMDLVKYDEWLNEKLDELEVVLKKAEELKIWILIDIHQPPGARLENGTPRTYLNKTYGDYLISIWRRIATRFKDEPMVWGYDLMNEPVNAEVGYIHYLELQYEAIVAIREIDPLTPIIVASDMWSSPESYFNMMPLPFKDIIYQVHMYAPHEYTHQGVDTNPLTGASYPGVINNEDWNRARMEKEFSSVFEFQRKYGARIYLGEFSAIRWAPGAERYMSDVIEIAESHEWDWTYHAYREWSGWSVEHGSDKTNETKVPTTPRKELMLKWFAKNTDATPPWTEPPVQTPSASDVKLVTPSGSGSSNHSGGKGGMIAGVTIAVIVVVGAIIGFVVFFVKRSNRADHSGFHLTV